MNQTNDNEEFCSGKEYIWACELTKEKPTSSWQTGEDEDEKDFLTHTLFLKQAVLGVDSVKGERNIVQVTSQNANHEEVNIPIISLTLGQQDSTFLDLCFGHTASATFTLIQGDGPVCITGQESIEYPEDDITQDEDEFEDEVVTEDELPKKPILTKNLKKRKAQADTNGKAKKGRMEGSPDDSDEDMDSNVEEDEVSDEDVDDSEESEDEDSSPEKPKGRGRKPKLQAKVDKISQKPSAKKIKDVKLPKPAAAKKVVKKGKK